MSDRVCPGCAYTGEDCTHVSKETFPKQKSITVEDVKRLILQEGEILLIKLPRDLTEAQMQATVNSFLKALSTSVGKALIYQGDIEFMVIEDKRK